MYLSVITTHVNVIYRSREATLMLINYLTCMYMYFSLTEGIYMKKAVP